MDSKLYCSEPGLNSVRPVLATWTIRSIKFGGIDDIFSLPFTVLTTSSIRSQIEPQRLSLAWIQSILIFIN